MYQQQMPQPRDESWSGPHLEYEAGYTGDFQQSEQLADAVARRLQIPTATNMRSSTTLAGQRLALAIVSVAVLIPLTAITLGILQFEGLFALGIISVVILGINFVFSYRR